MKVGDVKSKYDEAKEALDALEDRMTSCTSEIVSLKRDYEEKLKVADLTKFEIKKVQLTIDRIRKDRDSAEKLMSSMRKKYHWIESEMNAFGLAGGDYDFEATDPAQVSQHLKELKEEQDSLVSSVFGRRVFYSLVTKLTNMFCLYRRRKSTKR